jgi:hypothetical protein
MDLLHANHRNYLLGQAILQYLETQKRFHERCLSGIMHQRDKIQSLANWTAQV